MGKSSEFHGVNQLKFHGILVIFRCFLSTFSSVTTSEIHVLWVLQWGPSHPAYIYIFFSFQTSFHPHDSPCIAQAECPAMPLAMPAHFHTLIRCPQQDKAAQTKRITLTTRTPLGIVTGWANLWPVRVGYRRVRVRVGILLPVKNPYPSYGYRGYRFSNLGLTFNESMLQLWAQHTLTLTGLTPRTLTLSHWWRQFSILAMGWESDLGQWRQRGMG